MVETSDRVNSTWRGGKVLAGVESFKDEWYTMAEYEESGASLLERKFSCIYSVPLSIGR